MNKIDLEADVRKFVRDTTDDKAWWIEPARGSTFGLPDCILPHGPTGAVIWFELKVAELKAGGLYFEVRPKQRDQIRKMLGRKQRVVFIIGIKRTTDIMAFLPTADTCFGHIEDINLAISQGYGIMLTSSKALEAAYNTPYGQVSAACELAYKCDNWTRAWHQPGLIGQVI